MQNVIHNQNTLSDVNSLIGFIRYVTENGGVEKVIEDAKATLESAKAQRTEALAKEKEAGAVLQDAEDRIAEAEKIEKKIADGAAKLEAERSAHKKAVEEQNKEYSSKVYAVQDREEKAKTLEEESRKLIAENQELKTSLEKKLANAQALKEEYEIKLDKLEKAMQ